MKPLEEWTEQYLLSRPIDEDYRFDRKASQALIEHANGPKHQEQRAELSCDLSVFANSHGGFLIYGINNDGNIDNGVPLDLKNGTVEWLDNVIPGLVQPRLPGV